MQNALDRRRPSSSAGTYPLVINGEESRDQDWIDSLEPVALRQIVGRCGKAEDRRHAEQAIAAAKAAFPGWRDTMPAERADFS